MVEILNPSNYFFNHHAVAQAFVALAVFCAGSYIFFGVSLIPLLFYLITIAILNSSRMQSVEEAKEYYQSLA